MCSDSPSRTICVALFTEPRTNRLLIESAAVWQRRDQRRAASQKCREGTAKL